MRMLLCVVLALSLAPAPIQRTLRLVLIEPAGETLDADAMHAAEQAVFGAAGFWHDRAPFVVEMELVSTEVLTTDTDVYTDDIAWALLLGDAEHVTIVVVDNRQSRRLLLNGRAGGWAWGNLIVVTFHQMAGQNALEAMIAHELGHVVFRLPDLYPIRGACDRTDIMCYPVAAYNTPTIGCASLDKLGTPCARIHLSIVLR